MDSISPKSLSLKVINYIVIRYDYNQSMTQRKVIGLIKANNRNEAMIKAWNDYSFYNNQCLELKLVSRAGKAELQEAIKG